MAADLAKFSLADLEKFVAGKKSELISLRKTRAELAQKLKDVDHQIAVLEGKKGGRGRFVMSGPRKKSVRRINPKSLRKVVGELLANNKKGYNLQELEDAVLKTGYKTNSTKFKNTLYQCLYNNKEFTLDRKSGTYKLVADKAPKAAKPEKAEKAEAAS